jgi:glucokinase
MILAGDVGGTHTRLAWCEASGARVAIEVVAVYPSRDFESLGDIVRDFVSEHPHAARTAAFGVAGPVRDGRSKISNLSWEVDGANLARLLGLSGVVVANDLEATAYGIASLEEGELVPLNRGEPEREGNEALIAPGTGLGEAGLHWEGDCHRPFASEGGHSDFAPRDELECELLLFLSKDREQVSCERVISGPGLSNIYRFLRDSRRAEEPATLRERRSRLRSGTPFDRARSAEARGPRGSGASGPPLFELPELGADAGRSEPELPGGSRDAPRAHHAPEVVQVLVVEPAHRRKRT